MQEGQASRTALGAAGHRAAHQILERGSIFSDPLALAILGQDAEAALARAREEPESAPLRLFIAMRSRFAEDAARRAIGRGVLQIVVLGAGFDTFAYRLETAEKLRVFELDHPATQADKRQRLAEAGIAAPRRLVYVAHNFDRGGMAVPLEAAGFDPNERAFVLWLGVTPYLTEDAVYATLTDLARLPGGVEVVFDYANPPRTISDAAARNARVKLAERVAAVGEPLRCFFDSIELQNRARALGFAEIEDLDRAALVGRYLPNLSAPPRAGSGGHVARMATR
jgi:methyltransferase (TIGR00027 family)